MASNKPVCFIIICLALVFVLGEPGVFPQGFWSLKGMALAEDKDQAPKPGKEKNRDDDTGEESEPAPCPECPECPDPAKVVLMGLEEKKSVIEKAQKTLNQDRKDLERYEEQIDEKLSALESLKKQIQDDMALLEKKKTEKELEKEAAYETKIGRLVRMYAAMKPKNAALIVNKMNLEVAQEIFFRMREASASQILSFVDSEKAAKISERLAYKRN